MSYTLKKSKSNRNFIPNAQWIILYVNKKGVTMKIFHLSDLHIGMNLMNYDLIQDQKYVFDQIIAYAQKENPDVIVIAGDIYDKAVPSAQAVELFDAFISTLSMTLPSCVFMMISGNHDSAPRIDCFRHILSKQKIYMIGQPPQNKEEHIFTVDLKDAYGPVRFYLLPFIKPSMVRPIFEEEGLSYDASMRKLLQREDIDTSIRNVLVSHQFFVPKGSDSSSIERMDSEVCTVGNIDQIYTDILADFDYVALGHIHKPIKVGSETIQYCGTPMPYSLSEAEQEKHIVMIDLQAKGNTHIQYLPLSPLHPIRKLSGTLEELLAQANEDYVSLTLTDDTNIYVADIQKRLRIAFPHVLEMKREYGYQSTYQTISSKEQVADPWTLCSQFLGAMNDEEEQALKDIINTVLEVEA